MTNKGVVGRRSNGRSDMFMYEYAKINKNVVPS